MVSREGDQAALTTALRFLSNAFAREETKEQVVSKRTELISHFLQPMTNTTRAFKTALATTLLNFSVVADREGGQHSLCAIAELLHGCSEEDDEAAFRALVAVGTIVHCHGNWIKELARDLGFLQVAEVWIQRQSSKAHGAAADVLDILSGQ